MDLFGTVLPTIYVKRIINVAHGRERSKLDGEKYVYKSQVPELL
jgi:hypothetical protein